jgi:lysophospholipase L1-like esterase
MKRLAIRPAPHLAVVALATLTALAPAVPARGRSAVPHPSSMAAIGDSWTAAYCTDSDCTVKPRDSWSTGWNPAVDSQYLRILVANKAIHGRNYNIAAEAGTSGPGVADLSYQAGEAIAKRVDYVTIALGENDVCGGGSPTAFRAEFKSGMDKLTNGLPNADIFVASIDDLTRQWRALHADPATRSTVYLDCGLGPATTPNQLHALRSRIITLDRQLSNVCHHYPHCRYDNGAVFRIAWREKDFSRLDYGHLSIAGQRLLAATTWKATFPFGK